MIKYKVNRWGIEKVEVERETESSVWIRGRKNAKRSGYDNYFDSFEECKAFLISRAESCVSRAKRELEYAEKELKKAQSTTEND